MRDLLLLSGASAYLLGLLVLSEWTDRSARLGRLARHPLAFALALGVYATSFTLFGAVGYASETGFAILGIYLGATLSCLAIPVLWGPLVEVVRRLRVHSAADLLAVRFADPSVGRLVTTILLLGLVPYLSLQLRALGEAAAILHGHDAAWLSPAYAVLLSVFAVTLGVRHAEPWTARPGLVATLAAETLFKIGATLVIGLAALRDTFGDLDGVEAHFAAHPERVDALYAPVHGSPFLSLTLLAFFGAFLLPRQFHVAFVLVPSRRGLRRAIWVFPLVLCLLVLPLPVLLEAGRMSAPPGTPPELFVMTWTTSASLQALAFLAAVSGSSAMVLVTSIALSGMVVHHFVLPNRTMQGSSRRRLRRLRQIVMAALLPVALGLDALLSPVLPLVDLGLASFAVVVQLAPGVIATLFWPRATKAGFLAGMLGGTFAVAVVTVLPILGGETATGIDPLGLGFVESLLLNAGLLIGVSLVTQQSAAESRAALECRPGARVAPLTPTTLVELENRLRDATSVEIAETTLARVYDDLAVTSGHQPPDRLRRIVTAAERELAATIGPLAARAALAPPVTEASGLVQAQLRAAEERRTRRGEGTGIVRAWLLALLRALPDGVVATDASGAVLVWNDLAAELTGVSADAAVGRQLDALPASLLALLTPGAHRTEAGRHLMVQRRELADGGTIVLLSDRTRERALLAETAHQDRLATVGRVTAGVAHEVRNPLTGMMMVAHGLRDEVDDDQRARLDLILSEGQRIADIVSLLLAHVHATPDPGGRTRLAAVVDRVRTLSRLDRKARHLQWDGEIPPDVEVMGGEGPWTQVLLNLVQNAAHASPDDGTVTVTASSGGGVVVDVLDDGPGVDAEMEARLFEPFSTTKPVGEGTVLGLSVSWRIVQAWGGTLSYARVDGRTRFRVEVPVPEPEVPR
jgi:Na+/proline symporter/nitrogen-specific signal transduction histidine kinase